MTLLETVIALVILALSAVGALELFQQTTRSVSEAQQWTIAASYAEQGLEAAKLGPAGLRAIDGRPLAPGYSRLTRSDPAAHGLLDITVTVVIPDGAALSVHRLARPR